MENRAKELQLAELMSKVEGWASSDFLQATRGSKNYSNGRDKFYEGSCIDMDITRLREDGVALRFYGNKFRVAVMLCDVSILAMHKEVTESVLKDLKIPVSHKTKDTIFGFGLDRDRQALGIFFEFERNGDFTLKTQDGKKVPLMNIDKVIFKPDKVVTYNDLNDVITSDKDSDTRRFVSAFNRLVANHFTFRGGEDSNPAHDVVHKLMNVSSHLVAAFCEHNKCPLIYTIDSDKGDGLPRFSLAPKVSFYHGNKFSAQVSKPLDNIVAYVNHVLLYDHIAKRKPSISNEDLRDFVSRLNVEIDKLEGNKRAYYSLVSGRPANKNLDSVPYDYTPLDGQLRKSNIFIMANNKQFQNLPRDQMSFDQTYQMDELPNGVTAEMIRKWFYPVMFYPSNRDAEVRNAKQFARVALEESPLLALDMFNNIERDVPKLVRAKIRRTSYSLDKEGELQERKSLNIKTNRGAYIDLRDSNYDTKEEAAISLFLGVTNKTYKRAPQTPETDIELKGFNEAGQPEFTPYRPVNGSDSHFFISSEKVGLYADLNKEIRLQNNNSPKESLLNLVKKFGWNLDEEIFLVTKSGYNSRAKLILKGDGFGKNGIKVKLQTSETTSFDELENEAYKVMFKKIKSYSRMLSENAKLTPFKENEALGRWLDRVINSSEGQEPSTLQK